MTRYVCVTGAAGFLGNYVVEAFARRGDYVYAVDSLTYAARPNVLHAQAAAYNDRIHIRPVDVRSLQRLPDVDAVIHLAASTHVDNSLTEATEFVSNNVGTTAHLLELVRAKAQHGMPHFVHISTDEVYGSLVAPTRATEGSMLRPSSPYSASKAAADLLVQAWQHTYCIPTTILRPTNAYGIGQYPEKLIPKAVRCAQLGRPFPMHGDGQQTRQWLDARDFAAAVLHVVDERLHGIFNVGGNTEASVKDVVRTICPTADGGYERLGADDRYAVDDTKLRASGWTPAGDFWRDLPHLIHEEQHAWRW